MEREGNQRLEIAMPSLARWMAEYRAARPEIDQVDPADDYEL